MKRQLQNLIAATSFFTRLPLYRLMMPPKECYSRVLPYAVVAGWLVGLFGAACWIAFAKVLPFHFAVILTMAAMVLFTGSLHEDGFADFVDGFGGGLNKERILAIMKDSHIGTYGVISLVLLFIVRFGALTSIPSDKVAALLISGAVVGRFIGVLLPSFLPYARTIEASKIQVGLVPMSALQIILSLAVAASTDYYFFGWTGLMALVLAACTLPATVIYLKRKIGGYTGDCCGMLITSAEVAWYVAVIILQDIRL